LVEGCCPALRGADHQEVGSRFIHRTGFPWIWGMNGAEAA
jgi:hypothetical protein